MGQDLTIKEPTQPFRSDPIDLTCLTIENNSPNIPSAPSDKSDTGQHLQFLRCFVANLVNI